MSTEHTSHSPQKKPEPFLKTFIKFSLMSLSMGLSFTFSFEVLIAIWALNELAKTTEEEAATTLVSTMMNTVVVLTVSSLFAMPMVMGFKLGAYKKAMGEKTEEENTWIDRFIEKISCCFAEQEIEKGEAVVPLLSNPELRKGEADEEENGKKETPNERKILTSGQIEQIEQIEKIEQIKKEIEKINPKMLLISAGILPFTFLPLLFSEEILRKIFGQDPEVARIAAKVLSYYSYAAPALVCRVEFEQIIFAFGKTTEAMLIGLGNLSVGSLIALSLGFGVNIGPVRIPKLGPKGVAIGFAIEAYLTAFSFLLFILRDKDIRQFKFFSDFFKHLKGSLHQYKEILSLGGSITFTMALEMSTALIVGVLSGLIGEDEQSAMAYIMQYAYFQLILIAAFGTIISMELSREMGRKNYAYANKIAKHGLLTSLFYLIPAPLFFSVYPKALSAISGGVSPKVFEILKKLEPIMSAGIALDGVRYGLLQQLRGLGNLMLPNLITVFSLLTGIALSVGLGLYTNLGIDGVAIGYSSGIALATLLLFPLWLSKLPQEQEELSSVQIQEVDEEKKDDQIYVLPLLKPKPSIWKSVSSMFCCSYQPSEEKERLLVEKIETPTGDNEDNRKEQNFSGGFGEEKEEIQTGREEKKTEEPMGSLVEKFNNIYSDVRREDVNEGEESSSDEEEIEEKNKKQESEGKKSSRNEEQQIKKRK